MCALCVHFMYMCIFIASTHLNQLFEGDYPKLVRLFTYLPEYIHRQPSSQESAAVVMGNTYTTGSSDKGKDEFSQ